MHATLPLLVATDFPALRRHTPDTLQVNLGYTCNQSCLHCHVNAGPNRTEQMSLETVHQVLDVLRLGAIRTIDLTGGAPEMNQHFRLLVSAARELGVAVIDRCNLTILKQPGYETMAQFLADHQVKIVASLPCYLADNVDKQRGDGVFNISIRVLQLLNALGYGAPDGRLTLDLVYNPQGAVLPPSQTSLKQDYDHFLGDQFGIRFNQLFTIANMPIQRFGSTLVSKGQFHSYMSLLRSAHRDANLDNVMCRSLISVDYLGYLYDCDFNQMLGLPLKQAGKGRRHLTHLLTESLADNPIVVADHCWGCTAGAGSSCGGALAA
ncbi:radical SAM/Cys-rich protein [Actimicrobium sp. GrIS 1.19]|uniref:arsenosugar biosynthesis radical SAM (seleno)protein ArsS n=1 Tax=Actimicrobium sp. GrIS 1.19 TaxID=3071708 RepID=UPI002E05DDC7|nr:arsenosugar biosynthesis radical SAM (seleno)protein ArsS [Actimicrobium sp. GrIS 1.19]MEC5216490.1 radical SAM/Cys-rich protein [Actimicrobium sp. GrIS 1.19]